MKENKEKLEFLKREEIRTMAKDLALLREAEAQRERERIAALEPEKAKREEKIIPAGAPEGPAAAKGEPRPLGREEKPVKETLIPRLLSKRPRDFQKVLVRGVVVFLCLLLISGFFYWILGTKRPPIKEVAPLPTGEEIPLGEEVVEKPKIIIPPSLITVRETKTPEISKTEEIPEIFSQLTKEELPENSFTRLAIKNLSENRLTNLEELSFAFQIEAPSDIYQKLEPDYTLSIYSQKEGKRAVLIGRVKDKEGLNEILKNWEKTIESEGLSFSGKKIPTLVSYFRTSSYQGVGFRYLTVSKADLGICYAWTPDDYFILTTSFESMKKVIEGLQLKELEKKAGQLFIIGFEGKTVTPELEETFKKYRPGGVLLLSKNIENKEQLKNLTKDLQSLSLKETGLPLLIAADQEGGIISRIGFLLEKTSQSEIKNTEEAYQVGLKRGEELKELGVNLNLAPVLDIANSGDFLFDRSFQKPAGEIGELAKSLISGQKAAKILTTIKHFPGYGGISFNPEEEPGTLLNVPEISQFKKALEAEPEFVMTSNVIYKEIDPSLPFIFSSKGIQFLKTNLGNEILVISDDLDQNSLLKKFSLKDIMTRPIQAGIDILIFSGYRLPVEQGLDIFFEAVKNKEISEAKINEAVSKVIILKNMLK